MTDGDAPERDRARAFGNELIQIHHWFRRSLASARKELDEVVRGGATSEAVWASELGEQLRARCLTFCQMLHGHHRMEDAAMFPGVERAHPELAAVLERLRGEHHVVADILDKVEALLTDAAVSGPDVVAAEFDRLADELEDHLDYEEEQLVPVLNSLIAPGGGPRWGQR